jgi:single-strand DNA-binding protein
MNQIIIEGNLGSDPELKAVRDETLSSFSLAHTPRKKVNGQYEDGETIWFRVTFWNSKSDSVIDNLKKGDRIVVIGKVNQSTYKTKDGETKTSLEIAGNDFYLKVRSAGRAQVDSFATERVEDVPSW